MQNETKRKLLIIPVIVVGVAIFVGFVKNRAQPEKTPLTEQARAVRVIEVPQIDVVPAIRGTGTVRPSQVWNGVAQVGGKIIETHPQLKKGAVIQEGEVVLKIDPSDYELGIERAKTNIQVGEAQLAESKVKEKNAKSSLKIEEKALRIAQDELQRKRTLVSQGTVTRSELEKEERNVLAQQQSVQSLKNTINLLPVERQRLQADIDRLKAQLKEADLALERTAITMPFTGRIAESNIELKQFVRQGDRLVVADGISKAEVEVDLPMERLAALVRSNKVINVEDVSTIGIGEVLGLSARVLLQRNEITNTWEGKIVRTSDTMDPRTRTIGVIVEVKNPYKDVQPGVKPPLVKGMFVEVEIRGKPMADKLVIPRSALDNQHVYVADAYNRLERRAVQTKPGGATFVIVESGLQAGERVVISDISPAISGMLLEPVVDNETLTSLVNAAGATTGTANNARNQRL
ncbi:MAG: efflux RND transporter periplasmic adaptor subunit [Gammaproteobacteria bacterium]|jgi:RND family efflux transporter MFP subunit